MDVRARAPAGPVRPREPRERRLPVRRRGRRRVARVRPPLLRGGQRPRLAAVRRGARRRRNVAHHRLVVPQHRPAGRRRHVRIVGAAVQRARRRRGDRADQRRLRPRPGGARPLGAPGARVPALARAHPRHRGRAAPARVRRRHLHHRRTATRPSRTRPAYAAERVSPDSLDSSLGGTRGGAWLQDRYTVHPPPVVRGRACGSTGAPSTATRSWRRASPPRWRSAGRAGCASRAASTRRVPATRSSSSRTTSSTFSPAVVTTLRHERATHLVTGFEKDLGADTLSPRGGLLQDLRPPHRRGSRIGDRPARAGEPLRLSGRAAGQRAGGGADHQHTGQRRRRRRVRRRRLPGAQRSGGPAGRLALLRLGPRRTRHLWPALPVRVRTPPRVQRREPLPARRALEHRGHGRRWRPASPTRRRSGCGSRRTRTRADASSRRATRPARWSIPSTLGASTPCSGDACPTTPASTCASPTSRAGPSGRWSWYIEAINLLNRDNPVELETSLAHDPGGPLPRIVESPTAGFPIIPSFGVRVRF